MEISDRELHQFIKSHLERVNARKKLGSEDSIELMKLVVAWMRTNGLSRKICADVFDEINRVIQNLSSKQIKKRNGLAQSARIRDYYDTETLIAYSCVTRVAANLIRHGIEPIEAVQISASLGLNPQEVPQEIRLIENIHKVTRVIKAKKRELEAEGKWLLSA